MYHLRYTKGVADALRKASAATRKAFYKQTELLIQNLQHPSLHAKKYNETNDVWQARVNKSWRFYFTIAGDTYFILAVGPHPK
jgi:mRNA-degrading endonuclease RelE of RelBE toxin-antitoxin system